jgi:hypothetical protein
VSAGVPEQGVLRDFRQRRDARETPSMPPRKKPRPRRVPSKRPGPGAPPAPTSTEAVSGEAAAGSGLRRLSTPRPVAVQTGERGVPTTVANMPVEAMLEDWVVEDRWWTGRPVRRRYLELVLVNGRNVVVFKDLVSGRWFAQRA